MLFCKHAVWFSPELSRATDFSHCLHQGVNVDRSLNLTVCGDRLDAVSCKVEENKKIIKKGFYALHLEGP